MISLLVERQPDWDELRKRLERPLARAVMGHLLELDTLFDQVPHVRSEAMELARFACGQMEGELCRGLAEMADFPRDRLKVLGRWTMRAGSYRLCGAGDDRRRVS